MSEASLPARLFQDRFGVDERALTRVLETALERSVDQADLFLEYSTRDSAQLEDGIVRKGSRQIEQGIGVRVQAGERQGYAHSDEITVESATLAASTARAISEGAGQAQPVAVGTVTAPAHDLYPVATPPTEVPIQRKVQLLEQIESYAKGRDPRVSQVVASVVSEQRHLLIAATGAASPDTLVADVRPLVRLNVQAILQGPSGRREVGIQGIGGRYELDRVLDPAAWQPIVDEAIRIASVNLEARPCPAGTFDVVLGSGWAGVLLHEAVGHGLEGDFNRKGSSAFSGRLGEQVAARGVTVVDDGTLQARRGSLNVDDEGTPTERTVLIEDGVLCGYMQDRLNARRMGLPITGNGRRQSYAHMPIPRMTNTFLLAGNEEPEDILGSVANGIYAVSFGGGQVDITSGKFVFQCSEAYRIENGQVGAPVRGATLIGNGPEILQRISRIGHDLELDLGIGTCGKEGQGVPVGVGLPTVRIDGLTVGGTQG
ncbi:MAG: metalloprotease TldD [Myxococcota bacterium]|nr:metalloprotease TldD [Myxococcota bacterium]